MDMKYWNIPVTPHLNEILETAVRCNAHVTKSDLIRCAVREKLAAMGLKEELENIKGKP
jgi:Arc/MetJ-type ribon-helix-helix transcriptional regulator